MKPEAHRLGLLFLLQIHAKKCFEHAEIGNRMRYLSAKTLQSELSVLFLGTHILLQM